MAPTTHLTAGRYHSAWELITGPHLPASRLGRKAAPQASSRPRKASQNREAVHHRGAAREPFCRRAATRPATMPSSRVTAWIFSRNPFSQLRLCGNTKLRGKLNTSPANKAQFQIRSKESSWNLDADILVFEREAVILIQGRSEEHTSELQSPDHLVCRLLLEKKNILDLTGIPSFSGFFSRESSVTAAD